MSRLDEIVLALHQSAEPGQCGSCHFFKRDPERNEYVHRGICMFKLPPTAEFVRRVWDGETQPLGTVEDTDGCDLWRHSGKTYIVSQRIKP